MGEKPTVKQLIAAIAKYQFGQSRKALLAVEKLIRDSAGNSKKRAQIREQLAALLQSDEATLDCKRFVCRQLSIIGGATDVPVLAGLLADEDLSHYARYALQRMRGRGVNMALREALGSLKGDLLVGVINTIGERRSRRAARSLSEFLGSADLAVAGAAAAALGKMGTTQAADALINARDGAKPELRPALADACLQCAQRLRADGETEPAARIYKALRVKSEPRHVWVAADRGLAAIADK